MSSLAGLLESPGIVNSRVMESSFTPSRALTRYAKTVVFFAILLVWWGAATTTKQAGMVFADWPLSLGSINPPGWLENIMPFLEHSHRLLANLVGFLVLGLFCWTFVRSWKQAIEVVSVVVFLAVVLGFFIAAGMERTDQDEKIRLLLIALILATAPIAWLIWSWSWRRWHLLQKLAALALLMVTTQAILGGLRVTEISNAFAVVHGCFAQAFFCVLILIVMVTEPSWERREFSHESSSPGRLRIAGIFLVSMISMQLIFGASMRHFHRHALADDGLFMTQGKWIPSFEDPIIVFLFLHKLTAFCLFLFVFGLFLVLRTGGSGNSSASRIVGWIFVLILCQISLGLAVIGTGKSFWVTNLHVLNGLVILAFAFVFCVRSMSGNSRPSALANSGGTE